MDVCEFQFPSPLVYKHKPLVIIGSREKIVLWAGTQDEFPNVPGVASGYYDDCELKVREHDLHLNDNTRIEPTPWGAHMDQMKHTALLPCPFCGGPARVIENSPRPGQVQGRYVFCDGCGGMWDPAIIVREAELIERWNTRAALRSTEVEHEL